MKKIVWSFREKVVSHIQLGGGEPMCRFGEMVDLIRVIQPGADIWMATYGYGLTEEKALTLKIAELTGVAISHPVEELLQQIQEEGCHFTNLQSLIH